MDEVVSTTAEPGLDALPPAARTRVVTRAAEVLPEVPQLPPSLRRVAAFAPARRAKLGAGAIGAALADDDLRERVAVQLKARAPAAADPADEVALAWLLRPEGWVAVVAGGVRRLAAQSGTEQRDAEVARLRARLEQAEQAQRELRASHRVQVDDYKAEISSLRRRLGESRAAERAARTGEEQELRDAVAARDEAQARTAAHLKEVRRLRAQVAALEEELAAGRRTTRAAKDEATVRARVLLETLLDAAGGLQRELALPPVSGNPGDRVEAEVAQTGESARAGGPVRPSVTPVLLEQYLAMPRARLVVDGYNVSKTAWPQSSLEAQRIRLLKALAPVVARTGAETTVVFDAAASSHRPVVGAPRGVKVLFSPEGVIADDVIRDLVTAEPVGRVVLVVTSDGALGADVARAGARVVPSDVLRALLDRTA
ncbi:RNA-binding protein [Nocardioides sp. dk4132]|uniref:NYN domain-containing protein n=1 Tax=unclassified Nocardioides TaxID=2615069 RepID=UPI001295EE06|nr:MULTISPECIES: NYN domain-containing protein [unclassified Nocardioides]MQW76527.1 RNA-binding protein [Nocardioides sp. dk4132]QGA07212.1 RNA-binding protein [Nocardioides sp. dk884]